MAGGANEEDEGALGGLSEGATVAVGFVCVVLGGVMSGTYSLPMRFVRTWAWENLWLVYCSMGGFLFPLIFCAATAPAGLQDYLTPRSVLPVVAFGVLWGFASVLFGLAIPLVGQSLTFGIVLSLSSAVGSILPMLIFHTEKSGEPTGAFVWAGLVVAVVGVALLSVAGVHKEREQAAHKKRQLEEAAEAEDDSSSKAEEEGVLVEVEPQQQPEKEEQDEELVETKEDARSRCALSKATLGIVMCVVSGVLSPMLNLGFTFGDSIRAGAEELGASSLVSSSTVWVLAIGAGFVFNGGYPIYLLCRHGTWHEFRIAGFRDTCFNTFLMFVMAVLWFGGTVIYGIGATLIGSLGATIGWPVYMALMVLSANIGALLQGEWRNTTARPRWLLVAGLLVLLLCIVFFALSSVFDTDSTSSTSSSSVLELSSYFS